MEKPGEQAEYEETDFSSLSTFRDDERRQGAQDKHPSQSVLSAISKFERAEMELQRLENHIAHRLLRHTRRNKK